MIIRKKPKDINNFVAVKDDDIIYNLTKQGFQAEYMDYEYLYYRKSERLLKYIEKGE